MIETRFINSELISGFRAEVFRNRQPFPWTSFDRFLTEESFRALRKDFPEIGLFEKHENLPRKHYQRAHNRYYLAYEKSIYHPYDNPAQGVVRHDDLPPAWQGFLEELKGEAYRNFLRSLLGVSEFNIRYAWHIGVANSEVSPHRDAQSKIATHIFYFNTSDDWSLEWGGETLVLCGKRTGAMNPDFGDFDAVIPVPFLDNRSFLFKNGPDAWHGTRTIHPPEGKHRRLFNVIVTRGPSPVVRLLNTKLIRNYVQPLLLRVSGSLQRRRP